jgi:pyruvate dehydrogenase E1 component beta subunit
MMVSLARQAAEQLAADGIEAEVIDLRTLVPLDEETILASVAKTGRLVIADEGRLRAGIASEIAATVSEQGFDTLKAPVARVARADAPVSNSQPQEAFISPTVDKVVEAAKRLTAGVPAAASS